MRTRIRSLSMAMACVLCLMIALTAIYPVTALAAEPEQKTVRVGYVNVPTYEEGGEGEYKRGFGYEYLQRISYSTGWQYEYVYGSFSELLKLLMQTTVPSKRGLRRFYYRMPNMCRAKVKRIV